MEPQERTWSDWMSDNTPSFLKPAPPAATTGTVSADGVMGGRKRKSKKTRRGGKRKSRRSRK